MALSVLFLTVPAFSADRVQLENGDVITGRLNRAEGGLLYMKTDYSKPLEIKVGKIKNISTDDVAEVHLTDGQIIKGKLSSDEEGNLVVASDVGVVASVSWDKVEAINPPPVKWRGNIHAGVIVENGNTDRVSANAGAEVKRKTKKDRFSMRVLYNYAEEEEELTVRNTFGAAKYDYLFTKHFYGYLAIEMYSDEFRDLNLRTTVGPGAGLQVWDDDMKTLLFEAGAVYRNYDYIEAEDEDEVNGRGAMVFAWTIKETITLSDDFVYYHDFEDNSYQLRNEAAITSALTQNWALRLAHILEYDDKPPPLINKTDMIYLASLQYTF